MITSEQLIEIFKLYASQVEKVVLLQKHYVKRHKIFVKSPTFFMHEDLRTAALEYRVAFMSKNSLEQTLVEYYAAHYAIKKDAARLLLARDLRAYNRREERVLVCGIWLDVD